MNRTLVFKVDGIEHEIELVDTHAPKTLAKVLENLPATVDVHCAKIAGSHIMWPVPFVEQVEKASDVLTMPAGSFFFWPERQYLEITYDALQSETAAVSYLGKLKGDVSWLRDYAERQRREQGQKLFTAEVFLRETQPVSKPVPVAKSEAFQRIRTARLSVWEKEQSDVQALLNRRGLNVPFGPLSMAEGELRKLHELLWRLWNQKERRSDQEKATIAVFALEAAITRVGGFCHMLDTAAILQQGIDGFEAGTDPVEELLIELILYTGRMAAWLDLHICWWPMNELTLGFLENR